MVRSALTQLDNANAKNQIIVSSISDAFLALRELHIRNGRKRAVEELSSNLVDLGMSGES